MTEISFVHTPVSHIDNTALNGSASTLKKLSFTGANFTTIPSAFLYLSALEHLTIYDSAIADWNVDAMNYISQTVVTLYLQNVGLTIWPEWIGNFTRLVELSILYSSISAVPDDALDNMGVLNLLSIIHCKLTSIPKTISNVKSLQLLQLLQNEINDITWLPRGGVLTSLNLYTNNISDPVHLGNALRPLSDTLRYITLQYNQLEVIPDLSFMTNLGDLDLSYNRISDAMSGSMPPDLYNLKLTGNLFSSVPQIFFSASSVTYMMLGYNVITNIKDTDFPLWISEANLENNLIAELMNESFPVNSSLVFLNLNGNPITSIDMAAFNNLVNLGHLNLQQTKLTRLPLALISLTGLKLLDVRNNIDLVCTCLEKSLEPLIMRLLTVAGSCGVASLQDFFDNLSALCPSSKA